MVATLGDMPAAAGAGQVVGEVGTGRGRPFRVEAPFAPAGDQPKAIEELADGIEGGERFQTLLGITGSGI